MKLPFFYLCFLGAAVVSALGAVLPPVAPVSGERIVKPQEVVNSRRLTLESGAILQKLWAEQSAS